MKIITSLLVATVLATSTEAKNHIAFVNVGNAIADDIFANMITNELPGIIQINYAMDKAKSIDPGKLVADAAKGFPRSERQISVYFVDSAQFPPQITSPGFFAVMNVRGLTKDADAKKYQQRIKKMILKGLAFSCGFGANQDMGRCVMGAGSFETLKGVDGTSASYSPFCYFPLCDYLNARKLLDDTPVTFEE